MGYRPKTYFLYKRIRGYRSLWKARSPTQKKNGALLLCALSGGSVALDRRGSPQIDLGIQRYFFAGIVWLARVLVADSGALPRPLALGPQSEF